LGPKDGREDLMVRQNMAQVLTLTKVRTTMLMIEMKDM
jgi:hypothetical protein